MFDYFTRTYNIYLKHWDLPLIESTRGGLFPMELAHLVSMQKYMHKLSPDQVRISSLTRTFAHAFQTSAMIKFAVTRPPQRLQSIAQGVKMLDWSNDRYLKHFGITVDPNLTVTKAKLLQNPEIMFAANQKLNPSTSGRWDLRGKKFLTPNTSPLKTWGVCVVGGCCQLPNVQNFFKLFVSTYIGHGGRVERKEPFIHMMAAGDKDLGQAVADVRQKVGNLGMSYIFVGRWSWLIFHRSLRTTNHLLRSGHEGQLSV